MKQYLAGVATGIAIMAAIRIINMLIRDAAQAVSGASKSGSQ